MSTNHWRHEGTETLCGGSGRKVSSVHQLECPICVKMLTEKCKNEISDLEAILNDLDKFQACECRKELEQQGFPFATDEDYKGI